MTTRRIAQRVAALLMAMVVSSAHDTSRVSAQDNLAHAKDLYLAASYDEALTVLDGLQGNVARDTATEVAQYRVLCLLALNRSDDARKAIENMVALDPFYRPSDTQMSPRVRTVIEDTRKAVLPSLVQQSYAEAKAAFDRKDPQSAKLFERVLLLLDDPDMPRTASTADLRTVASGFLDLSKALSAAAAPPPPTAPVTAPAAVSQAPAAASTAPRASDAPAPAPTTRAPAVAPPPSGQAAQTSSEKVVPPVTVTQTLPVWNPNNPAEARRTFRGSIEITIDERGNVVNAMVRQSVNATYDAALLESARSWKYKPATRNGVPVAFQKTIDIQLNPTAK